MRKTAFIAFLLFLPVWLFGNGLEFQSPSFSSPFYRISFQLEVKKEKIMLQEIQLNDQKFENFSVFSGRKRVEDFSKPLETGTYDIFLDYAWKSNEKYRVSLLYHPENSEETREEVKKGTSPKTGGIPSGKEGFYRVFRAEETIGLERTSEIVCLTLTAPKEELMNESLLIFEGDSPLEYQILGIMESVPAQNVAQKHPPTWTFNLAVPLDMSPLEKKIIVCLRGESEAPEKLGFVIEGEGPGKTVKNKRISLEFHPQSGQVNVIEYLKEGIRLHNKEAGVIHWNPGCYIPGVAWDHSFNWNPPPSFEERIGNLLYVNSRRGPFQKIKDIVLEVRYTLGLDSPYFISETMLSVKNNLGVIAIRNDEMVLHKDLFDSLVYRDKKNSIIQMPLQEKEGYPDGLVHVAPDDIAWAGLVNSRQNYGFFSLRIEYANSNLRAAGNWLNKPGTYFYAPSDGKYVYWVRPLLYTWSDFTTRNLLTFVPEGSTFYEKNAYILLPLDEDFPNKLDTLLKKLKDPIRIY
jgi:hypothetical protein